MSITANVSERTAASSSATPAMESQQPNARRPRPSNVQTNISSQFPLIALAASAMSSSSIATSSHQDSPIHSPDPQALNMNGSIQVSPEPLRGRDLEQFPPPLQLPDAVVSRKTSNASLATGGIIASPGLAAQEPTKSAGIIRRLSTKVSGLGSGARRQSSAHAMSRDGSVGPFVRNVRLRSNSNSSAMERPAENAFLTDSDDDILERDESSLLCWDGSTLRDLPLLSSAVSASGSSSPQDTAVGPVIPSLLLTGTWVLKLSKNKNPKRILLALDSDNAKIYWDKTRPNKAIYLDDIKEIRTGGDLNQYRREYNAPEFYESRGFSLKLDNKSPKKGMIHLVADDEATADMWVSTIEAISKQREVFAASLMSFNDRAIRQYWNSEASRLFGDRPHALEDESIDFAGVQQLCRNFHINVPLTTLLQTFAEVKAAQQSGKDPLRLSFEEFLEFLRLLKTRKDIVPIFREFASDIEAGMTRDDFFNFLRDSQGENVDDDLPSWEAVFSRHARKGRSRDGERAGDGTEEPLRMSVTGLVTFLTSTSNMPLAQEPRNYVLDRPANEYYISSSHNTYLLGRQVAGISSVEGYISSLMRGCRCVEVDCWDGQNNEPIVSHGRTLTTQIPFIEVIKTINKYAFHKSLAPLWISLEVRCNLETQAKMAQIMLDIFGEKLITHRLDPTSNELPTIAQLMGRILIKVKKPQQAEVPDAVGRRRGNSLTSPLQRPLAVDNGSVPASPLLSPSNNSRKVNPKINTIREDPEQWMPSNSTSECESDSDKDSTKKSLNKINPVLGDLGVYSAGIHFDGFDTQDAKTFNHIFSFKEKTFKKHSEPTDRKRLLYRHNMRHMMRVYPNGTRIGSSNFRPDGYWKRGVQMAALNWQTWDLGMQMNHAMFASGTEQSGYVLKSLPHRQFLVSNGNSGLLKQRKRNVNITIDVISAQQLMRPFNLHEKRTVDPYVEVELYQPDDSKDKTDASGNSIQPRGPLICRTKIVQGNGFNPVFDNKSNFNTDTKYDELVFIRFLVKLAEKNGNYAGPKTKELATFTAKLCNLKQGYRTLPLLNTDGDQFLFSSLFCRIKYDVTDILAPAPDEPETGNKFRGIKGPFFNRGNPSPKSSLDSGMS